MAKPRSTVRLLQAPRQTAANQPEGPDLGACSDASIYDELVQLKIDATMAQGPCVNHLRFSPHHSGRQPTSASCATGQQHITPEQAAEQVFDAGVRAHAGERKPRRLLNLEIAEPLPIFDTFAVKPGFSEAVDHIIAISRSNS
jgi:hypothetical protein